MKESKQQSMSPLFTTKRAGASICRLGFRDVVGLLFLIFSSSVNGAADPIPIDSEGKNLGIRDYLEIRSAQPIDCAGLARLYFETEKIESNYEYVLRNCKYGSAEITDFSNQLKTASRDEFQRHALIQQIESVLQSPQHDLKAGLVYKPVSVTLGEYDFKRKGFALRQKVVTTSGQFADLFCPTVVPASGRIPWAGQWVCVGSYKHPAQIFPFTFLEVPDEAMASALRDAERQHSLQGVIVGRFPKYKFNKFSKGQALQSDNYLGPVIGFEPIELLLSNRKTGELMIGSASPVLGLHDADGNDGSESGAKAGMTVSDEAIDRSIDPNGDDPIINLSGPDLKKYLIFPAPIYSNPQERPVEKAVDYPSTREQTQSSEFSSLFDMCTNNLTLELPAATSPERISTILKTWCLSAEGEIPSLKIIYSKKKVAVGLFQGLTDSGFKLRVDQALFDRDAKPDYAGFALFVLSHEYGHFKNGDLPRRTRHIKMIPAVGIAETGAVAGAVTLAMGKRSILPGLATGLSAGFLESFAAKCAAIDEFIQDEWNADQHAVDWLRTLESKYPTEVNFRKSVESFVKVNNEHHDLGLSCKDARGIAGMWEILSNDNPHPATAERTKRLQKLIGDNS